MTDQTPQTDGEKLFVLWQSWEDAVNRLQAAQTTLIGAQNEEVIRKFKFIGSVEFAAGGNAQWAANTEKKTIEFTLVPVTPQAGSGETTTDQPNTPAPLEVLPSPPEHADVAAATAEANAAPPTP
jgi:hypothetical protein